MYRIRGNRMINFMTGIRVLYLMNRISGNRNRKVMISQNENDFREALAYLRDIKEHDERIYSSINKRSFRKAYKNFKERQVEMEFMGHEYQFIYMRDIHHRWVSSLMKPSSRLTKFWLLDFDTHDLDRVHEMINNYETQVLHHKIQKLHFYPTPKGFHYIVNPFNSQYMRGNDPELQLHKDGLMLWN